MEFTQNIKRELLLAQVILGLSQPPDEHGDQRKLVIEKAKSLINVLKAAPLMNNEKVMQNYKVVLSKNGALYDIFMCIWLSLSEHIESGILTRKGYMKLMHSIETALCGSSVKSTSDEKKTWKMLWNLEHIFVGDLNRIGLFLILSELLETWSLLIAIPHRHVFAWALLYSIIDTTKLPPKPRQYSNIRKCVWLSADQALPSNGPLEKHRGYLSITGEAFQRAIEVQALMRSRREGLSVGSTKNVFPLHPNPIPVPTPIPIAHHNQQIENRDQVDMLSVSVALTDSDVAVGYVEDETPSMCDSLEERFVIDDPLELHRQGLWTPALAIPSLQRDDIQAAKTPMIEEHPSSLGILVRGTNASPTLAPVATTVSPDKVTGGVSPDYKFRTMPELQSSPIPADVALKYIEHFKKGNLEYEEIMRILEMDDLTEQFGLVVEKDSSKLDAFLMQLGNSALVGVNDAAFIEGVLARKKSSGTEKNEKSDRKEKTLSTPYRNTQALMDPVTVRRLNANKGKDQIRSRINSGATTPMHPPADSLNSITGQVRSSSSVIESTDYIPIEMSHVVVQDHTEVNTEALGALLQSVVSTVTQLVETGAGSVVGSGLGSVQESHLAGSLFTDTLYDDVSFQDSTDMGPLSAASVRTMSLPVKKQEIKYILKNDTLLHTNLLPAYPSRDTAKVRIHMLHEANAVFIPVKAPELLLKSSTSYTEPKTAAEGRFSVARRGVCNEISMVRSKLANVQPMCAQPTRVISNLIPVPVAADLEVLALESDSMVLAVSRPNSPVQSHEPIKPSQGEVSVDRHCMDLTGVELDDNVFDDDLINSTSLSPSLSPRTIGMGDPTGAGHGSRSMHNTRGSRVDSSKCFSNNAIPNSKPQPVNNIHFSKYMRKTHSLEKLKPKPKPKPINASVPRPHVYPLHVSSNPVTNVPKQSGPGTTNRPTAMSVIDRKLKELGSRRVQHTSSFVKKQTNKLHKFLPDPAQFMHSSGKSEFSGNEVQSSPCSIMSESMSVPNLPSGANIMMQDSLSVGSASAEGGVEQLTGEGAESASSLKGTPKINRQQSSIRKQKSSLSPQSSLAMNPDILPVGAVVRSPPSVLTSKFAAAPMNILGNFNMHSSDSIRSVQSPLEKSKRKRDIATLPHFLHAPKYTGGVVNVPDLSNANPYSKPGGTIFSQDRSFMSDMSVNTDNYGSFDNGEVSSLSAASITSKPFSKFTDHSIGSYSKGPFMGSCLSSSAPWIPEGSLTSTVHTYGNKTLASKEELAFKRFENGGFFHDNSESRAAILRQNTARASFEGFSKQSLSSTSSHRGVISLNPFQEKMVK